MYNTWNQGCLLLGKVAVLVRLSGSQSDNEGSTPSSLFPDAVRRPDKALCSEHSDALGQVFKQP